MTDIKLFETGELVSTHDGKVYCTSLMIAEKFEKEHKNVLRAIHDQIAVLPEDFCRLNFELTSTEVAQPNGGVRSVPMYELTRDGFSFIVMGFTGEKAALWKVKFIEAFNAMEEQLRKSMPDFDDPVAAARAWADAEEKRILAERAAELEARIAA